MSKRILLISPNDEVHEKALKFLQDVGYKCVRCSDEKQAVDITLNYHPDLIICDQSLVVLSGNELARLFKSREQLSSIPFVLLTTRATGPADMERLGLRMFCDDVLVTPFNATALYGIVTKWLEGDEKPKTIVQQTQGPLAPEQDVHKPRRWDRGDISVAATGKVIFHLLREKKVGRLLVKGDRKKMAAWIERGRLLDVESNFIREDSLGTFLVALKKITQRENEASYERAQKQGVHQGDVIVQMGLLSRNDVDVLVKQQKVVKVLGLFKSDWDGAAYAFQEQMPTAQVPRHLDSPLDMILKMGVFKAAKPEFLWETFEKNHKLDVPLQLSDQFPAVREVLRFDDALDARTRALVGRTLRDIRENGEDFEADLRLAFLLAVSRALEFGVTMSPTPPPKSPPKTAEPPAAPAKPAPPKTKAKGETTTRTFKRPINTPDAEAFVVAMTKASTFVEARDFQKAMPYALRAHQISIENSDALALYAWCMYNVRGKSDIAVALECKELFKRAIGLDANNDIAYLYLGRIFKDEGKDGLALMHFEKARKMNPANEEADREVRLHRIKIRKDRGYGVH